MPESKKLWGSPKEAADLLGRLEQFERESEAVLKGRTPEQRKESLESLRARAEELRNYLALHLAPKEMADWRELPDSDAEIAAFGYELRMEHADLHRELGDLVSEIEAYDKALDRQEAAMLITSTAKALAIRIARHIGGEKAPLGRLSA
jgi:asparagine synthetase B (glutamine-hydrolysing)